ncbi:MAG TPA: OB-fold nucleic acid binding domain-containing protein, partial [Acidimicrobiales bacterium]|nr:OB-fold nucleic acid binding domain-containing protein [Acidimicrobiales bacterium]
LEALATAGATASLTGAGGCGMGGAGGGDRRRALWAVGALAQHGPNQLEGIVVGADAPALPAMTKAETVVADLWATGVATEGSLTELARAHLDSIGVTTAAALQAVADGQKVKVAGLVTHRQRPGTAGGVTFVSLEDETGLVNVICSVGVWARYRRAARSAAAMIVQGRVEAAEGVVNVVAERIESLRLAAVTRARDFS